MAQRLLLCAAALCALAASTGIAVAGDDGVAAAPPAAVVIDASRITLPDGQPGLRSTFVPTVAKREFVVQLRDTHGVALDRDTYALWMRAAAGASAAKRLHVTVEVQPRLSRDKTQRKGNGQKQKARYGAWRAVGNPTVWDRRDGTLVVTYHVALSGRYRIALSLGGVPLRQSPVLLSWVNSRFCACGSTSTTSKKPRGVVPSFDAFDRAYGCSARFHSSTDPQLTRDLHAWTRIRRTDLAPHSSDAVLGASARRHYAIVDNVLYSRGSDQALAAAAVDPFFHELLRKVKLPDSEFVLTFADMPYEMVRAGTPARAVLGWCGHTAAREMLLPTWDMMGFAQGTRYDTHGVDHTGTNAVPWDQKRPKLVWRGGDFGANGRRQFVALARQHPDLLDGAFTYAYAPDPAIHGPIQPYLPFAEFFHYKFVANVDGAAAAYRLPFLFGGGSLVFWQTSPYYEHVYAHFKPMVHYVPVRRDFSDLLTKVRWAIAHDDEARAIAWRGQQLARRLLQPENVWCYTAEFLRQYSQRLAFTPTHAHPNMTRVADAEPPHPQQVPCRCKPLPEDADPSPPPVTAAAVEQPATSAPAHDTSEL